MGTPIFRDLRKPIVNDCYFDPGMDCPINTKTLRAIYKIMDVAYDSLNDIFTASNWQFWGIAIEDQHDDEVEPHYRLEVGEGKYSDEGRRYSFSFRYCDYHSTTVGKIVTNPGKWYISVWLPDNYSKEDALLIAKQVSFAYEQAMIESLPDYEILSENNNFR